MKNLHLIILKSILLVCTSLMILSCQQNINNQQTITPKLVQLQGTVLNLPQKAHLELALFGLDAHNRPQQLLAVERYVSKGNALSFQFKFDLNQAKQFTAIELRGRVSQAKVLKGYLSPWHQQQLTAQNLTGIVLEFPN